MMVTKRVLKTFEHTQVNIKVVLTILAIVALGPRHSIATDPAEPEPDDQMHSVTEFIGTFCKDCHGHGSDEGERNFDGFTLPIKTVGQLVTADEIIDQLTLKLMPPPDGSQPDDKQRLNILQTLRQSIADARESFDSTGGRTVMRRLSNREYENTMAALFNRRVDTLGLTANFPKDT